MGACRGSSVVAPPTLQDGSERNKGHRYEPSILTARNKKLLGAPGLTRNNGRY